MNRLSGMMKLEGLPKPVEALRVRVTEFGVSLKFYLEFLRVHGGHKNPVISRYSEITPFVSG